MVDKKICTATSAFGTSLLPGLSSHRYSVIFSADSEIFAFTAMFRVVSADFHFYISGHNWFNDEHFWTSDSALNITGQQQTDVCLNLSLLLICFLFLLRFILNVVHKKSTKHRSKTIRQWRAPTEVFRPFQSWDSSFQWYSDSFRDEQRFS